MEALRLRYFSLKMMINGDVMSRGPGSYENNTADAEDFHMPHALKPGLHQ